MRFTRIVFLMFVAALTTEGAGAQGVWFDIASGEPTVVLCGTDGVGWEYFPPYPFGPRYPPQTRVYAELSHADCAEMPEFDCQARGFVAGFVTYFNDAGCGCGGILEVACRLRVHYEDHIVRRLGAHEGRLLLLHYEGLDGWQPIENVVIDPEENMLEGDVTGVISGLHYYAIASPEPESGEGTTWGRIKALAR